MDGTSIRRATTADLTDIRQLIAGAYMKYIERIGRPPAPMTADYTAVLQHSRVWVLDSGYRETGRAVQDGFRRVFFSKTVGNDDVGDLPDGDRRDHLKSGGLPQ